MKEAVEKQPTTETISKVYDSPRILMGAMGMGYGHPAWNLDKGSGTRVTDATIIFPEKFKVPPCVNVSLTGADSDEGHNFRLRVDPVSVTSESFVVRFGTWEKSQVYAAWINWIAVGE